MTPLLLLLALAATPTFDQYRVTETVTAKTAPPIIRTRHQRAFRTRIREATAAGPNFAGHYALAQWGCGAGCISFALIDTQTGAVVDPSPAYLAIDAASPLEPVQFRRDSRLLVLDGCPEEKNCGVHYYEWTGKDLKVLHSTSRPSAAPMR